MPILVIGDSMLINIDEKRSSYITIGSVLIRSFPGSNIDKMYNNIAPLLKIKPKIIILHIGTNDAPHKTANTI